jgi:hypothetical protein
MSGWNRRRREPIFDFRLLIELRERLALNSRNSECLPSFAPVVEPSGSIRKKLSGTITRRFEGGSGATKSAAHGASQSAHHRLGAWKLLHGKVVLPHRKVPVPDHQGQEQRKNHSYRP